MSVSLAFVAASLAGTLASSGVAVPAQNPPASQGQQPPAVRTTVEVVATILPEEPKKVPASVEVITGDDLRARGARNLREALALATGISVAPGGDGGPAGSVPEFWGLREFDAFLLVVDGIPWGGAFNPALASLNMHDVERIEVLRGPAPVTFGATSFVGVIHVVHTAAAAKRTYFGAHGGAYGSGGVFLDFGVPSNGAWKSRFSVDFDKDGFKDPRTDFNRTHVAYRGAADQTNGRMWFTADLTALRQSPASPHPREGAALSTNVPMDANVNPSGSFINENRFMFAFGLDRHVMTTGTWATTVSFTHSTPETLRGFLTDISNTPNNATGFAENIDLNDFYADSHLTWPAYSHFTFITGVDFLFGNGEATGATFTYTAPLSGDPAPSVTPPSVFDKDSEDRRQFYGLYGIAEWRPATRLNITGGVRLNYTSEQRGEANPATTNTRPSGTIGANYLLWESGTDSARVFANYRDTFKPAAFDFGLAENEGILKPETSRSFEAGAKLTFADGRVDIDVSGFRMDFSNLVASGVVGGLPVLINQGKTRFQGVEIGSELRFGHDVNGRLTYSYHDGKFVDFIQDFDGVLTQLGGKRFEMSANHLFSAGVILAPEKGVVASAVVNYVGDRYLNKRNTALAEAFTTVDVGGGYRWGVYEIRVDGRNLSNRRDAVSESELGDAQYYLMTARTVLVSFAIVK